MVAISALRTGYSLHLILEKIGRRCYFLIKRRDFMKVLGLDIGEKRIGIAISDALGYTAQGMQVLNRSGLEDDLTVLRELIKETETTEVVVGLPKNMDGSLGESAQKVLSFAKKMEESLSIPVILRDERWTTAEATRLLVEADLSRGKRRKVVDKLAAVLILQGYLDSLDHREEGEGKG
jgi:putative Holliday junction resolvase